MNKKPKMIVSPILDRIKLYEGFGDGHGSESRLAALLDITPQLLKNWRDRNTIDMKKISTKCKNYNLNWLLQGQVDKDLHAKLFACLLGPTSKVHIADIAEKLGIKEWFLYKIANGHITPSVELSKKILDAAENPTATTSDETNELRLRIAHLQGAIDSERKCKEELLDKIETLIRDNERLRGNVHDKSHPVAANHSGGE